MKIIDPILKQKIDYWANKYDQVQAKADEEKYRYASIIEQLEAENYDLTDLHSDEEVEALLDWKQDFEIKNQARQRAQAERFNLTEMRRQVKRQKQQERYKSKTKLV